MDGERIIIRRATGQHQKSGNSERGSTNQTIHEKINPHLAMPKSWLPALPRVAMCSVVSGTATLIAGSGQINGVAFSGNTMTVNLRNVAEVQKITVTFEERNGLRCCPTPP